MISSERRRKSFEQGRESELEFKRFMKREGFEVKKSTQEQDMFKHIDFFCKKDGKVYSFDIKGVGSEDENYVFIEMKNINGDQGWLFGEANYIVFEMDEYWVFVKRKKLITFLVDKLDFKVWSSHATESFYTLYSREGRDDIITMAKTVDIIYIAEKFIKK